MARQKIDFTEEQRKDFSSSLIETIRIYFQKIFKSEKPLHGKELNDFLLSQTESEEERETLQEMFDENETYHIKLNEFKQSGRNLDEWYEEEIAMSVKQLDPNATANDIDKVKEAVAMQADDETEDAIRGLESVSEIINANDRKEAAE